MSYSIAIFHKNNSEIFHKPVGSATNLSINWQDFLKDDKVTMIDRFFEIAETEEDDFMTGHELELLTNELAYIIQNYLTKFPKGTTYSYDVLYDLYEFLSENSVNHHHLKLYFF